MPRLPENFFPDEISNGRPHCDDDIEELELLETIREAMLKKERIEPYFFLIERSKLISFDKLNDARRMVQQFCGDHLTNGNILYPSIYIISYAEEASLDVAQWDNFPITVPEYRSGDGVSLNAAIALALDTYDDLRLNCACSALPLNPAKLFIIGTGRSSDDDIADEVCRKLHKEIDGGSVSIHAVGNGPVDVQNFCSYYSYRNAQKAVYATLQDAMNIFHHETGDSLTHDVDCPTTSCHDIAECNFNTITLPL